MYFCEPFASNIANQVNQSIHANQAIVPEIESLSTTGPHDANQAFNAIVNIHERARLLTVAPNLDRAIVSSKGDLAANRCRSLLSAPLVSSEGTIYVMESHYSSLKLIVLPVIATEFFGVKLFPSVAGFRIGRKCVFFFEWSYCGCHLLRLCVNARRRREKKPFHTRQTTRLKHVRINQNVVARDHRVVRGNEANASHVRS